MPSQIDPIRLSKTMAYLLRHEPQRGGLELDDEGWVPVADLARGASRLLRAEIEVAQVERVVQGADVLRFELEGQRIRAVARDRERRLRPSTPDILYHATTSDRVEQVRHQGRLTVGPGQDLFLAASESEAWRVAHRLEGGRPMVLYVDASQARRRGVRFRRYQGDGLYVTRSVPLRHVLNLQPDFAEQLSAGGIPMVVGDDGVPRLALIRVTRRSGVTWEVAKGKMEPGEVPEETAVREVQEEMGVCCDLDVVHRLGHIRYGFLIPGGRPRLKTVYLYLMEPLGDMGQFSPSAREGIQDVRWFTPDEACKAVTHTSLIPMMHRARRVLIGDES